jgi:hypothetical protein
MVKGPPDPTKFGEGYSRLEKYLTEELYKGIDGFIGKFSGIPEKEYENVKKANDGYKASLEGAKRQLKNSVNKIDGLVKNLKGAKSEEDAQKINTQINEEYKGITLQVSAAIYQVLEPEIDAYNKIINTFYTKDFKDESGQVVKGLDKKLFTNGSQIIKDYFIEDQVIEEIKAKAPETK